MNTTEYLALVRETHGLTSDYQLARFLGESKSRISSYRTGRTRFDDALCIKVADILGLPPAVVLADIAAERAHSADVARTWRQIADTFRNVAPALAIVAALSADALAPEPADAHQTDRPTVAVYILCKIRRIWRRRWRLAGPLTQIKQLPPAMPS